MSNAQNGIVAGNKQNKPGGNTPKSRSVFPLSYSFFNSERFADYSVFFVQEGVDNDSLPLSSNHEVQTYTFKAPLLQSVAKKKDFFMVPLQAILPLNYEKFITLPNIGEDVPDDCGLGVENFWSLVRTAFNTRFQNVQSSFNGGSFQQSDMPGILEGVFKHFILFELFYSAGNLLKQVGVSGSNYFDCVGPVPDSQSSLQHFVYDELFDASMSFIADMISYGNTITMQYGTGLNAETYIIGPESLSAYDRYITLREALELMRDDLSFTIVAVSSGAGQYVGQLGTFLSSINLFLPPATDVPQNLGRLWAYGLVIAHYYSNDHVDYIYSADLFRQYIGELLNRVGSSSQAPSYLGDFTSYQVFSVNGLQYQYDYLSAHYCTIMLHYLISGIPSGTASYFPDGMNEVYAYFIALLGLKRSLRFMDYFTGSRTLPYAVGDQAVAVVNNNVNVVELAKQSWFTRLKQAVYHAGRKFGPYMAEIFGRTPAYDYHNPLYLAHTSDLVTGRETQNTGEAQFEDPISVTTRLGASSRRYAFEFQPDRDCIVLGITYYDLPRVYSRATERQNFHVDRLDMFNPFMQYVGDQPIYTAEIGTKAPGLVPFSYTNRHMEYKQRFNQCAGAFCVPSSKLRNWIFVADELRRTYFDHLSPSFIRSFNAEFDKYFNSLSGWSLGTYFHFIVRYDAREDASRPMSFNPALSL